MRRAAVIRLWIAPKSQSHSGDILVVYDVGCGCFLHQIGGEVVPYKYGSNAILGAHSARDSPPELM